MSIDSEHANAHYLYTFIHFSSLDWFCFAK